MPLHSLLWLNYLITKNMHTWKKWDGNKKNQVNCEECSQPVAFVSLMYHQAQLEQSAEFKNVISVNNEPIKAINTE